MKAFIVVSITVILAFTPRYGYSQVDEPCIPTTNLINDVLICNPIFSKLNNYLISNNFVGEEENYPFYHYNILSKREFDIRESYGIYVFGLKSSHPVYRIYFQNNNGSVKIIDKESIGSLLTEFNEFCEINGVDDDDEKLIYLHGLIGYLNVKYGYPISQNCLNFDCD